MYLSGPPPPPLQLLDNERVRRQFNYALNLMNQAVEGAPLPAYKQPGSSVAEQAGSTPAAGSAPASYAGRWSGAQAAEAATAPAAPAAVARPVSELSLQDLVARFAAEHNITFMPKVGRVHEGTQVYAFGATSIVLDSAQSVVRAQVRDRWAPTSLETLLQMNT